jgi:hypothetical protein
MYFDDEDEDDDDDDDDDDSSKRFKLTNLKGGTLQKSRCRPSRSESKIFRFQNEINSHLAMPHLRIYRPLRVKYFYRIFSTHQLQIVHPSE